MNSALRDSLYQHQDILKDLNGKLIDEYIDDIPLNIPSIDKITAIYEKYKNTII